MKQSATGSGTPLLLTETEETRENIMRLRRDSWHYRLVNWGFTGEFNISENLCTYFWQVVLSMIMAMGVVAVGLVIAFIVYMVCLHYPWALWTDAIGSNFIINVFYSMAWIGGGLFLRNTLDDMDLLGPEIKCLTPSGEPKPPKEPGLVSQFIKAKKDKFCPNIEFVDGDDNE